MSQLKHALFDSLKRIYYADMLFSGDISFSEPKECVRTLHYLPVYDYMFERRNDIFIGDMETFHAQGGIQFQNLQLERKEERIRFKLKLKKKTLTNSHVVSSFIEKSKPLVSDWRIIHASQINVIDLGDSRHFKDADECIEKIKLIENCTCYVGSVCSWYDIAKLYDKPAVVLASDIEGYKKTEIIL